MPEPAGSNHVEADLLEPGRARRASIGSCQWDADFRRIQCRWRDLACAVSLSAGGLHYIRLAAIGGAYRGLRYLLRGPTTGVRRERSHLSTTCCALGGVRGPQAQNLGTPWRG